MLAAEPGQPNNRAGSRISGGGPFHLGLAFTQVLDVLGALPRNKPVQIVTVRSIAAECLFVKQTLDPASQAYLVGMLLDPDGPAHLLVPAAP